MVVLKVCVFVSDFSLAGSAFSCLFFLLEWVFVFLFCFCACLCFLLVCMFLPFCFFASQFGFLLLSFFASLAFCFLFFGHCFFVSIAFPLLSAFTPLFASLFFCLFPFLSVSAVFPGFVAFCVFDDLSDSFLSNPSNERFHSKILGSHLILFGGIGRFATWQQFSAQS